MHTHTHEHMQQALWTVLLMDVRLEESFSESVFKRAGGRARARALDHYGSGSDN